MSIVFLHRYDNKVFMTYIAAITHGDRKYWLDKMSLLDII
jgi:hypothetical protein